MDQRPPKEEAIKARFLFIYFLHEVEICTFGSFKNTLQ